MKAIFLPGCALLNRLRYPRKFLLIGFFVFVPLLLLGYLLIAEANRHIAFMERELLGVDYIAHLSKPLDGLQRHRGMSAALLNGDQNFAEPLREQTRTLDAAMAAVQGLNTRLGDPLDLEQLFKGVEQGWAGLKAEASGFSAKESYQRHTALIAQLREVTMTAVNRSNLILDSQLDSHHLMDLLVDTLPAMTERMGQLRGMGASVAAQGQITSKSAAELSIRVDLVREMERLMLDSLETIKRERPALRQRLEQMGADTKAGLSVYVDRIESMLTKNIFDISPAENFAQATNAINAIYRLMGDMAPMLDEVLRERIADYQGVRNTSMAVMLFAFMAIIYFFIAFYLAILESIDGMKEGIERVAAGDLRQRIDLASRDELSWIADQVNTMTEQFRSLVSRVMEAAQKVTQSAEDLSLKAAQSCKDLGEQRSQTDQVATAINEMNCTIQEVSRSASASAEAVHQAMEESNRGKDVVEQTMSTITILADEIRGGAQAVQVLGDESQNINQVLEVIRSIAEQTNLLALNAAIEAARAGDQGRGFAVVADEVRALAGRSQQATLEIRTMIERLQSGADNAVKAMAGSEGKTGESVAMAQRAGDALSAITGSVAIMADMSTQIASAAEEQSAVAEEINRSITRIAQIASQNVMCSERNAHVSSDLAAMSDGLRDMVAVFRV